MLFFCLLHFEKILWRGYYKSRRKVHNKFGWNAKFRFNTLWHFNWILNLKGYIFGHGWKVFVFKVFSTQQQIRNIIAWRGHEMVLVYVGRVINCLNRLLLNYCTTVFVVCEELSFQRDKLLLLTLLLICFPLLQRFLGLFEHLLHFHKIVCRNLLVF